MQSLKEVPAHLDVYTSWVPDQQRKPNLHVAALCVTGNKFLVLEDSKGSIAIPSVFHNTFDPGLLPVLGRLLTAQKIPTSTRGAKLLGVYEEGAEKEDLWFAVMLVPVTDFRPAKGFRWVSTAELSKMPQVPQIMLACAASLWQPKASTPDVSVETPVTVAEAAPKTQVKPPRPSRSRSTTAVAVAAGQ